MENTLGEFDEILFESNLDAWIVRFKIPKTQRLLPTVQTLHNTCRTKLHGSRNSIYSPQPKEDSLNQNNGWSIGIMTPQTLNISLPDESNRAMGSLDGILLLDNTTLKTLQDFG